MVIAIYIEPLKTFTTGMPHRGMLKELIKIRKNDYFILIIRKGEIPDFLKEFLVALKKFENWELKIEKRRNIFTNLFSLLHFKNHCKINVKADLYLNVDAHYLGSQKFPQVITVHDLSSVIKGGTSSIPFLKKAARKFAIKNGIKHADHIVSISDFTKQDILAEFTLNKPIHVIYNGIDPLWHKLKPNIEINESYWIWWGGFTKRKNLGNLLLAYELLLKEGKKIPSLLLIGNRNEYSLELEQMVNISNTLKEKVIFKRHMELSKLINLVANSKGLLFPSLYEGFGLPVIEAFSQGIPVLTSSVSSLPEISGGLAILVEPHDVMSIKAGMKKLLVQESINLKLVKWSSNFTYELCAQEYSNLIDKIKIK